MDLCAKPAWIGLLSLALVLLLAGCGRLDSIPYDPPQTPESWLTIQPSLRIQVGARELVLAQPSSTILVYSLGALAIWVGLYFWRIRQGQRARLWWGLALLLWGLGALFAGTSYEGFSYEIKCAGRAICTWSSWWELAYLLLSAGSVNAMLLAQAHSCAAGKLRKGMILYAAANMGVYSIAVLAGALIPVKLLISFELLLAFSAPSVVGFFALNGLRYRRFGGEMDLALLRTWVGLGAAIAAYFLYLSLGITAALWAQGVWFSENDVLHIGLVLWMLYIGLAVARKVEDLAALTCASAITPPLRLF
ncbi:MAG: hypothetical protein JXA78_18690 [Anaerolineales bacterium]|nr:hypothetical protein [Anaerolineales bacterium]